MFAVIDAELDHNLKGYKATNFNSLQNFLRDLHRSSDLLKNNARKLTDNLKKKAERRLDLQRIKNHHNNNNRYGTVLNTFLVTGQCPSFFCGRRRAKRFRYIRVPQPQPCDLHEPPCLAGLGLGLSLSLSLGLSLYLQQFECRQVPASFSIFFRRSFVWPSALLLPPVCLARPSRVILRVAVVVVVGIGGMKLKERKKKFYYARAGRKIRAKNAIFLYENIFEADCAGGESERGREMVDSYGVRLGPAAAWLCLLAWLCQLAACPRSVGCHLIILSSSSSIDDAHAPPLTISFSRGLGNDVVVVVVVPRPVVSFGLGENCGNKNRIQCRFFPYFIFVFFCAAIALSPPQLLLLLMMPTIFDDAEQQHHRSGGHHHSPCRCVCSSAAR